ncbi:MAG TPA: DUF445 family protein [Roseiarcus sp.]|nr:DUF445 family protein [Roseiarcus sp.]
MDRDALREGHEHETEATCEIGEQTRARGELFFLPEKITEVNKIVDATKTLIVEIRADSAHPVRAELDRYLKALIERLQCSSEFASRVDAFKLDLLERPEVGDLAAEAWSNLREFLVRDANSEDSRIRRQVGAILADISAE